MPWFVGGAAVGFVRHDRLRLLAEVCPEFRDDQGRWTLHGDDAPARTAALDRAIDALLQQGALRNRHGEQYPVSRRFGEDPLLSLDRATAAWFGVRAYGVHLNGFVRRSDGLYMWLAQRSRLKPTWPGRLDNMVAGGQPVALSRTENLRKECAEEAGIPASLAARARPVGEVRYCYENDDGLKPDTLFCYDLEVPADFEPRAVDGEAERFFTLPVHEVAGIVRDTERFKLNCNLVVLDFLLRHGYFDAEPAFAEQLRRLLLPELP